MGGRPPVRFICRVVYPDQQFAWAALPKKIEKTGNHSGQLRRGILVVLDCRIMAQELACKSLFRFRRLWSESFEHLVYLFFLVHAATPSSRFLLPTASGGSRPMLPHRSSAQSRFQPSDDHPLNLAGALVDFRDLGIAKVSLHRHFLAVAHAAVNLDGLVGNPHRGLRSLQLGHRTVDGKARTAGLRLLLDPGGLEREKA